MLRKGTHVAEPLPPAGEYTEFQTDDLFVGIKDFIDVTSRHCLPICGHFTFNPHVYISWRQIFVPQLSVPVPPRPTAGLSTLSLTC
ncbi:hypothetical protein E2C01_075523 [Portunus trituberculatus]|uniref:Uncharacterized protein n=1 Tax=Portunus trituberculatus TaxID=210409 RepID=A0A5B7IF96_PORTR|nr:hypothetical protein [Portunus trituberculatus]